MLEGINLMENGHGSNGHNGHNGNGHHGNGRNGHSTESVIARMQDKLRDESFLHNYELDLPPVDHPTIEDAVRNILTAVGENADREGLQGTPDRVARAYDELLSGYRQNPEKIINNAIFDVDYNDMVIVRDIEYYSLCEHHMLPFIGHAHIAYIPQGKVVGLSKLPRIVDVFARRLQVQERMTHQIADFIQEVLNPMGVAVVLEGVHMCSMIRGVEKLHSSMTTSAMRGTFHTNPQTRAEFMSHLNRGQSPSFFR